MASPQAWQVTLRGPDGRRYPSRRVVEDIDRPDRFRQHVLGIARVEDPGQTDSGENWLHLFELEVREPNRNVSQPADYVFRFQKEG